MSWTQITALFICCVVLLVIGYDLIAYSVGGNDATISRVCLNTANRYRGFTLCVAFAVGVLMGHLMLPQRIQPHPDTEELSGRG